MSYFGIALFEPKNYENYGGILRSAHCFGCSFISIIGSRFKRQATDTTNCQNHIPVFSFDTLDQFLKTVQLDCVIIRAEVDGSSDLRKFSHPKKAVYIFGGEDRSVPKIERAITIKINTPYCLNLASTASIFMYDRQSKMQK